MFVELLRLRNLGFLLNRWQCGQRTEVEIHGMMLHIVDLVGSRITQKTSQWACLLLEKGSTVP